MHRVYFPTRSMRHINIHLYHTHPTVPFHTHTYTLSTHILFPTHPLPHLLPPPSHPLLHPLLSPTVSTPPSPPSFSPTHPPPPPPYQPPFSHPSTPPPSQMSRWRRLDEIMVTLLWEWEHYHVGLRASRCGCCLVVNGSTHAIGATYNHTHSHTYKQALNTLTRTHTDLNKPSTQPE